MAGRYTDTLDLLGVEWRQTNAKGISVALMDAHDIASRLRAARESSE